MILSMSKLMKLHFENDETFAHIVLRAFNKWLPPGLNNSCVTRPIDLLLTQFTLIFFSVIYRMIF